ncbi:hypothetical protein HpMMM27_04150 [Helicobacter pylori]
MVAITPNTPRRIAEELQCYGGNTFANFFRNERVLYKEILCDVCDHLEVSYSKYSKTSLIEQNILAKLLKDSLEQMSKNDLEELLHELGTTSIDKMIGANKQILIASVLTLFKAGGSHSYALAITVADAMVKKTLGHGLSSVVGKVALTRTLSLLTGWNITGVWTAIYIAGPAYRVTVPACVLVATLHLKLKVQQEARLKAEQTKRLAKQKTEREANKTKRTWYLAIIFLIGLAVLAVFFIKREHHSSHNPNNSQKAVLKNSKTLATRSHKN